MTVLTMKAMGINDLLNFDFMDPPPPQVGSASLGFASRQRDTLARGSPAHRPPGMLAATHPILPFAPPLPTPLVSFPQTLISALEQL